MQRIIVAAITLLLGAGQASAQTSPNLIYGQVPTAAQWNSYFTNKADYLGAPYCPVTGCTMTGLLITAQATTAGAGINLPVGTAPTTPNNGDMWITSSGLFIRVGGSTVGPMAAAGSCITCALTNVTNTFAIVQNIDLGSGSSEPAADTGTGLAIYGADATVARNEVTAFGAAAALSLRSSLGTRASPTTLTAATLIASYNVHGYDGSAWSSLAYGAIHTYAEANWTSTSHPTEICLATTPITASATNADSLCQHDDGGLTVGSPTGADKGAGTINAAGTIYQNNSAVASLGVANSWTALQTFSSGITFSLGSDATGDIYYRSSGGVLVRLGIGTSGQALEVVAGIPSWQSVTGTGTVTSITPGLGLTSTLTATAPGSAITAAGTLYAARLVNAQTGTTYTVADTDRAKEVTLSNASAIAVTLPQAGAASAFQAGWLSRVRNVGVGTATITPTTSNVDGSASCPLLQGEAVDLVSDGTNYQVGAAFNAFKRLQVFTSTGANTFTPPCGTYWVRYQLWGAGGGTGGTNGSVFGAGGGGGGYCEGIAQVVPGTGVTITVGTGGTAGGSTSGAGGTGGSSSIAFAAGTVTANGGAGTPAATSSQGGGGGGSCSGGTISIVGGNGQSNNYANGGTAVNAGSGGASYGVSPTFFVGSAQSGEVPGGGASGGHTSDVGQTGARGEAHVWY